MSRYHSYLNTATLILKEYEGKEPLAAFLKKYFARDKKYGSADRRQIIHLCYCYYRLGKAFPQMETEKRILLGLYMCSQEPTPILEHLKPLWNTDKIRLPLATKLAGINLITELKTNWTIESIFPWVEHLSTGIDIENFVLSHFHQPDLFLRIRSGKQVLVKRNL